MKGFIEVIRQITDECKKHDFCGPECAFFMYTDTDGNHLCYLDRPPEHLDPLEIMRRLQAHD